MAKDLFDYVKAVKKTKFEMLYVLQWSKTQR